MNVDCVLWHLLSVAPIFCDLVFCGTFLLWLCFLWHLSSVTLFSVPSIFCHIRHLWHLFSVAPSVPWFSVAPIFFDIAFGGTYLLWHCFLWHLLSHWSTLWHLFSVALVICDTHPLFTDPAFCHLLCYAVTMSPSLRVVTHLPWLCNLAICMLSDIT
jgi:hypothetical protein